MSSNINVKDYRKSSKERPLVKFGKDFIDKFFFDENGKAIEAPVTALRIIYLIYEKFYSNQFDPKSEPKQLTLFDEEFLNEHNTYAEIRLSNNRICPTKNYESLESALVYLENYKKDWHETVNSSGKKVRTYGGLISNISYEEKGSTQFLISSYWLKEICLIPEYNYLILETAFKIQSNKRILFLLWLSKVNKEKGTSPSFKHINFKFSLNYSNATDLAKGFLKPIKKDLDIYSNISFNYSIKKDLISIMPYNTSRSISLNLDDPTKKTISVTARLSYFKRRHEVNDKDFKLFSERFTEGERNRIEIESAYSMFKLKCRQIKSKMEDYKGKDFLNEIQGFLIANYKKTKKADIMPNGYIKLLP